MQNKIIKPHWKLTDAEKWAASVQMLFSLILLDTLETEKPISLVDETQSEEQSLADETQSKEAKIKIHT